MSTKLWQILAGAGLAIGMLAGLVFGIDSCNRGQGVTGQIIASEAKGEANAHQTQAQASDKVVADLQAQRVADKKALDRLTAERFALLRRLESERQARLDAESAHSAPVESVPDVRDEVIAKDAEVIQAQIVFASLQAGEIVQLTISRDEWRKTAEARERQVLAQEAATKAWQKAVTSSKWIGRAEGFAVGVALGYVGGRR